MYRKTIQIRIILMQCERERTRWCVVCPSTDGRIYAVKE